MPKRSQEVDFPTSGEVRVERARQIAEQECVVRGLRASILTKQKELLDLEFTLDAAKQTRATMWAPLD